MTTKQRLDIRERTILTVLALRRLNGPSKGESTSLIKYLRGELKSVQGPEITLQQLLAD